LVVGSAADTPPEAGGDHQSDACWASLIKRRECGEKNVWHELTELKANLTSYQYFLRKKLPWVVMIDGLVKRICKSFGDSEDFWCEGDISTAIGSLSYIRGDSF
jgi:hypothetical protein